jgi:hypothetical protein
VTPQAYEAAFLAQTAWRLALGDCVDETMAIMLVLRNHVIPRPGQIPTYKSFPEACIDFLEAYPTRKYPTMQEDAFIAPNGILALCEQVYDCSYPDITATQTTPGARMFARTSSLSDKDWRKPLVQCSQLLGTFGSQQFFFTK